MRLRKERPSDHAAVAALLEAAFGQPDEAQIVAELRRSARPLISMVATEEDAVVGHILFSPVTLPDHPALILMGLGPMGVLPDAQGRGIGQALVTAGLDECHRVGVGAVVVLGYKEYYPKFGFRPASRFGLSCEYDVPDEVFMAVELQPGYLRHAHGLIRYHPALRES